MGNSRDPICGRWWRRFLALGLVICLLGAVLAGCGEKGTTDDSAQSDSTAPAAGSDGRYATVEDLLANADIRDQYKSSGLLMWGTDGSDVDINIYAADNRVVISYVTKYASKGLDLATMRANFLQAVSKFDIVCNTIAAGVSTVVETPNAGLRVEILTTDDVELYSCDYVNTDEGSAQSE